MARGTDENQLGVPETCLIPKPIESELVTSPKEGEKYFIRSARIAREINLKITITTLDTHDTIGLWHCWTQGPQDYSLTGDLYIERT